MTTDPISAGTTRNPGGCLQPVLLRGRVDHIDGATGELLLRYTTVHEPGGVLPIACKTRRASQCPPCAEVYKAETYQLIRAGLRGGKGVPETVGSHPCVFTTLTAPSCGPVHVHREKDGRLLRCRPRRRGQMAHTATGCPAQTGTLAMTPSLASHCARTATTTPERSYLTPTRPNCGAASPSPYVAPLPARPGSPTRRSPPRCGSLMPKSPNTNGGASSTSTRSSASTGLPVRPPHRPPGPPSHCSPTPSTRAPAGHQYRHDDRPHGLALRWARKRPRELARPAGPAARRSP